MRADWIRTILVGILLAGTLASSPGKPTRKYSLFSPDKNVHLTIGFTKSQISYSLSWHNRAVLDRSILSLIPDARYTLKGVETNLIDKTWQPVWGQFSQVRDHYRQLKLKLTASGTRVDLLLRAYNDGIAFRFRIPNQSGIASQDVRFSSEYNNALDLQGYFSKGGEPKGPLSIRKWTEKRQNKTFGMPALLSNNSRDLFLGILESDLYTAKGFDAANLSVQKDKKLIQNVSTAKLQDRGLITPWRIILFASSPGKLALSCIPINVAAKCELEDTSWIKPGKCMWDWRVHGYKSDGFVYGIDTPSYKRFIDFCAKNNIRYFLIDDHWYEKFENQELHVTPKLDFEIVKKYADTKGVELLLYFDRKSGDHPSDTELLKLYSDLGAKGIKYGFMGNKAPFTRKTIKLAAQNKLLIDFHDNPCPMTGVRRTLPNAFTRECCHAQQDARRAFGPSDFLNMAMVNAISGPLDQANGAYGLNGINRCERLKGPRKEESYNSTVVSETARTLVIFSGLICLPDAPEEYEKKADLFEFIREMPATWDRSLVLSSKLGEHIVVARSSGKEWFVGSVINEQGGKLNIPLDFLEKDCRYKATFYEDTPKTDYIENREAYRIRQANLKKGDTIEADLAPGGGHCIWIRPR